MGKIANAIKGQAIPDGVKRQLLVLDEKLSEEIADLRTTVQRLEAEILRLQTVVNPIQRENDALKARLRRAAAQEDKLDETDEKILTIISNAGPAGRITLTALTEYLELHPTRIAVHLRRLVKDRFIYTVADLGDLSQYKLNDRGEEYLVQKGIV